MFQIRNESTFISDPVDDRIDATVGQVWNDRYIHNSQKYRSQYEICVQVGLNTNLLNFQVGKFWVVIYI